MAKIEGAFMIRSRAIAAILVASGSLLGTAVQSHAVEQDGLFNDAELIFFYNSIGGGYGSASDFYYSKSSLSGYKFLSAGSGQGQYVKNNSASVINTDEFRARVYYNSDYGGPYDDVRANSARDLRNTYNDNASFRWVP